jgi:hypothetical protein
MPGTFKLLVFCSYLLIFACPESTNSNAVNYDAAIEIANKPIPHQKVDSKTIHVFVALCDNKYQGIVPVPARIGNGQDPVNNLYWGAGYGVKSFFKKSVDWKLLHTQLNPSPFILERLLFKHSSKDIYLLADAYDGQFILNTTVDFLQGSAGAREVTLTFDNRELVFGGGSDLIAYVGHDGLMDFSIEQIFLKTNSRERSAIILACYSKRYFSAHLLATGASPLLWTTGLMAPEAYILHDAIKAWISNKSSEEVKIAAAAAYSRYQKCSMKAAKNLFANGW